MDFPHLSDTKFPEINNVDVYKYKNNFDYTRWQGKVRFKLLNVLWNSNYADVPYFETAALRDEWFDEQEGYIDNLETLFNVTPNNSIKIPVPYNDACKYNYLVVDMPMQTSENNPLNYEDENRISRWFYFIDNMVQAAPSTTELIITMDYWTSYINSVSIPYLMLERGHAPMMETDVETYLANPIMNNEYLLADDFNYGSENNSIIQTSNYLPIGNGTKYVLFCAPYSAADLAGFIGSEVSGQSTPPTFSDITTDRNGKQLQVNGYQWKYGEVDYSDVESEITNEIQDGIFNGCKCYAILGTQAKNFFNACAKNSVNFIKGIKAIFILDDTLFTLGNAITVNNFTLYNVSKKTTNTSFTFAKTQFGFDEKYADITKLYTFPYSYGEITDDEGNYFNFRIENCSALAMQTEVSLIYPFLNYNIFFSGINGGNGATYTWKTIDGTTLTKNIWASDFSKYMMNWKIPVYSLYVSNKYDYAANHYFGNEARRAGAIKEYQNAVRSANNNCENIKDSSQTVNDNVFRNETGVVNNVGEMNSVQDTIVDEYMHNGNFVIVEDADSHTGYSYVIDEDAGYIPQTASINYEKIRADCARDLILLWEGTDIENTATTATAVNNAGSSAISGVVGGLTSGNKISGFGEILNGGVSAVNSSVAAVISISSNTALRNLETSYTINKLENTALNMRDLTIAQKAYDIAVKDIQNQLREDNTLRFSDVRAGSLGINLVNANATLAVETDNADYTDNTSITNAQETLKQRQREVEAEYADNAQNAPKQYGEYSGDYMADVYQRRGVRLNIRTQTKSAIAQAGDGMLRFGYALNRVWDMSDGFNYCGHFTFWKANDVWINSGFGAFNDAKNTIENILLKGVTVWRNPEEIGTISIYENNSEVI